MTYRKTWFSYVLWTAYAGLCVMLLAYTGYHIYAGYVSLSLAKLGALIIFPVLVSVYLGLRLFCRAVRKKHVFSGHGIVILESLVLSFSFVFGFLARLRIILHAVPASVPAAYYERALIRAGEEIEPLAHGLGHLYVLCLSAVFSFLGNGQTSAMLLQAVLQMAAMVLGFLVVKKAAGRLPAGVVLLSMAFSGPFLQKVAVIDLESLYLALYLLGLLAVISFVKANLQGKRGFGGLPGAVLIGILVGVMLYLELWSGTLLLFLTGLFTGKRENEDRLLDRILCLGTVFLSCGTAFFAVIGADAAVSGVKVMKALEVWTYPYVTIRWNGFLSSVIQSGYLFWGGLFLAAAFLVFEFLRSGREQNYTLWLLACVILTPVLLMDFSGIAYGTIAFFLWSVMAGLGIKNCVLGGQAEVMRARIEEINAAAEIPEKPKEKPEEKPRFLENPLPLPKKHTPREMDYDHQVDEADMHFDIETGLDDDFDL